MFKTSSLFVTNFKAIKNMKVNKLNQFNLSYSSPAKHNFNVTFTGNPLNRISDLRENEPFLNTLLNGGNANFGIFTTRKSLFSAETRSVAWFSRDQVTSLIPSNWEYTLKHTIPHELNGITVVLLGVPNASQAPADDSASFWAIHLAEKWLESDAGTKFNQEISQNQLKWISLRPTAFTLPYMEASIVGLAASIIDWNNKGKFCPCCGSRTVMGEAGYKRICGSTLAEDLIPQDPKFVINRDEVCQSKESVTNFSYPRTDPVAIFCIISADGEEILMGKKGSYPIGMYSCLAGFIEPGESLEEAVQREAFEESGIQVKDVFYFTSQPWPFPNNLMLGCYATAINKNITIDEKELSDARWFTKAQVRESLSQNSDNWKKIGKLLKDPENQEIPEFDLLIPDKYAIANTLIVNWANAKDLNQLINPLTSTPNSQL